MSSSSHEPGGTNPRSISTQSILLTGLIGRLAVALALASMLWLGTIWAMDPFWLK